MAETITISGNDDGQKLDRFLRRRFPQIPLSALYRFLRQEKVRLFRGEKKWHGKRDDTLRKGDLLKLFFDTASFGEAPEQKPKDFDFILKSPAFKKYFRVNYEDQYFWVADKPAGIAVHPGSKTPWGQSLIDLFAALVRSRDPKAPEPKLAHRLDKETSGLVLIAKNDAVLRELTALLRLGQIEKKYLALIRGRLTPEKGEIRTKLLRTEGSKFTKVRVSKAPEAKEARTLYTVKKYFRELDASLVEVILDTGRMHQIRVHFSEKGHPLAGDQSYGDFPWNHELQRKFGLKRQFLHAFELSFRHPVTGKEMKFKAELPPELKKVLPPA